MPRILDKDGRELSVGDRVVAEAYFVGEYKDDGSARTYQSVQGTVLGLERMCLKVRFDGTTRTGRRRGVHAMPIDLMWRCPDLTLTTPQAEPVGSAENFTPHGSDQDNNEKETQINV